MLSVQKAVKQFIKALKAPLSTQVIAGVRDVLVEDINNLTLTYDSEKLGELPTMMNALGQLTSEDFEQIASLINGVLGFITRLKDLSLRSRS